jgi:ER-bound oxygenase mpaB/B'/Rubber oxygenase, catalytic domain
MSRYSVLHAIQKLDPQKDHQRIVFLSSCYDFPFDTTRALEFALFRTFCVPSIALLLDRTGEFQKQAQKRYDDTDILVSELLEWGYDSDRGRRALRRINQQHGRFAIANEDFLYVLSTFIYEPIRWNERFGWRLMSDTERLAYFYFWREIGRRMNIQDIPTDYATLERFNRDYERQHYRFTEANRRVGIATRELFVSWFPWFLSPLVRSAIHSLLDDPLIDAFGFARPSRFMRCIVPRALRLRAAVTAGYLSADVLDYALKWLTLAIRRDMSSNNWGRRGPVDATPTL